MSTGGFVLFVVLLVLYLPVSFFVYRSRFPEGVLPDGDAAERERIRRVARRRVLPLPPRERP